MKQYKYRGHQKQFQSPLNQRMTIVLPLKTTRSNKINKKPIDLMLPPSRSTTDQPLEVTYKRRQVQPSTENLKIPELEENSDQDQFADLDTFMTHHNTHHASERI